MGNVLAQNACNSSLRSQLPSWDFDRKQNTSSPCLDASDVAIINLQCPLSHDVSVQLRTQLIGKATTIFYHEDPLKIVRTKAQYMYDEKGVRYLDCINNVAHVGHCHPHVVEAVANQIGMQCTNSRFLHDGLLLCAQRLIATMPPKLRRCFFVNSGSEANDLAMRMAMEYTGRHNIMALDHAYHGHLTSLVHISPHIHRDLIKYKKPPEWIHIVEQPDPYRGNFRRADYVNDPDDEQLTRDYVRHFDTAIKRISYQADNEEEKLCGFWVESMQSCAGQILFPKNYLKQVFELVRRAGGVCVADEVQVGFGRTGTHFWAFQMQDAIPDIVVIGKSMGNGYPVAAVVCTDEIAAAFEQCGHEFFSTFGGNPGACAASLAVLDVIKNENLMQNAQQVGSYLLHKLQTDIQAKYPHIVGDVRGVGLFIGIELISPNDGSGDAAERRKIRPNRLAADTVVREMRYRHVILSSEGPDHNVLKIKPPMCFNKDNADELVRNLDEILAKMRV